MSGNTARWPGQREFQGDGRLASPLINEVHLYPGEDGGFWAYRALKGTPPANAESGALWPRRPPLVVRLWHWWDELVARLMAKPEDAVAHHFTRNLWRRHPWQRIGDIWWRPRWDREDPPGLPPGTYETFDPATGLHRWDINYDPVTDFAFNMEAYYCSVIWRVM